MAKVLFVDLPRELKIEPAEKKRKCISYATGEEMQTPGSHVLVRESINIFSGPTSVSVGSRFYIFAKTSVTLD